MVIIPLSFFFAFFKILIIVRLSFLRIPKEASELISKNAAIILLFLLVFFGT